MQKYNISCKPKFLAWDLQPVEIYAKLAQKWKIVTVQLLSPVENVPRYFHTIF